MFKKSLALAAVIAMVEAHDLQAFTQQALDVAAEHKELEQHCRPVIGVGAQPIRSSAMQEYTDAGYTHYIEASYVQALNAVGARVVPLVPDADGSYTSVDELIPDLNGIFLTGGSGGNRNFTEHLLDAAQAINDRGKTFPVMGVCLSFQYMGIWQSSEKGLLEKNVAKKVSFPLTFVGNPEETKQFADLGDLSQLLADNAYLWNYHSWGINPISFHLNDGLRDFWNLTSLMYNDDEAQTPFVASMEAKDYPFFGVAFHPERPPTQPKNNWGLNRSEESLHLNEFFFRNFVVYARQNQKSNSYGSIQPKLIQNADTIVGDDYWGQVYLF